MERTYRTLRLGNLAWRALAGMSRARRERERGGLHQRTPGEVSAEQSVAGPAVGEDSGGESVSTKAR